MGLFLGDGRLVLVPIGAADGGASVDHGGLVNDAFAQRQIIAAITGSMPAGSLIATDLKLGTGLNGTTRLDLTTLEADGQADQLDPNPLASAFDLFVIDLQDQFKSAANLPSNVENQQKIVV